MEPGSKDCINQYPVLFKGELRWDKTHRSLKVRCEFEGIRRAWQLQEGIRLTAAAGSYESVPGQAQHRLFSAFGVVERPTGLEPAPGAWEASVLPLN